MFVLLPERVMGFFGAQFVKGSVVLSILAVGQFVNVATGSVAYLLMMSKHENVLRNSSIIGAILNFSLNIIPIPRYGFIGAAISVAISISIVNLIMSIMVSKHLAIRVWYSGLVSVRHSQIMLFGGSK